MPLISNSPGSFPSCQAPGLLPCFPVWAPASLLRTPAWVRHTSPRSQREIKLPGTMLKTEESRDENMDTRALGQVNFQIPIPWVPYCEKGHPKKSSPHSTTGHTWPQGNLLSLGKARAWRNTRVTSGFGVLHPRVSLPTRC